jgi:acetoin utilization protein AcuB
MRVRDWMSPDPVTVSPSTAAAEARRLLRYYGIRHLPVVERDRVVGMVSDRDVRVDETALQRIVARMTAINYEQLAEATGAGREVREVMSAPPHVITQDEPVEAAARMMLSRRISALPVIGEAHELIGVITSTDCLLASLTPNPEAAEMRSS